jgi:hypothetical protein
VGDISRGIPPLLSLHVPLDTSSQQVLTQSPKAFFTHMHRPQLECLWYVDLQLTDVQRMTASTNPCWHACNIWLYPNM